MKVLQTIVVALTVIVGLFVLLAVYAGIAAYPTMLVLGALHSSNGLSAIPALGFWQTLGSLFILGSIGSALGTRSSVNTKEGK